MLYAARHLCGDFLTSVVFIAVYASTGNLPFAIGATVLAAIAQIGWAVARKQRLDAMVWISLGLAVVFGGIALVSDEPRFIMVKPSLIHLAIGSAMLRPGWLGRYLPPQVKGFVPDRVIVRSGYGWALFMFMLAAANLVVAATASFATWAWFVSVGLIGAKIAAFIVQYGVFRMSSTRRSRTMPITP